MNDTIIHDLEQSYNLNKSSKTVYQNRRSFLQTGGSSNWENKDNVRDIPNNAKNALEFMVTIMTKIRRRVSRQLSY